MNIPDSTKAYLGGVQSFGYDFLKYAEALYSDKDCKVFYPNGFSEEKREELIYNYLLNSNEYFEYIQEKVNHEQSYEFSYISNNISEIIIKILENSPIK